jgi:hypothetical protein
VLSSDEDLEEEEIEDLKFNLLKEAGEYELEWYDVEKASGGSLAMIC